MSCLTARELLKKKKVQCRGCERFLSPREVVITEKAWADPDTGVITCGRTALLTLCCPHCIEETSMSLLLGGE